MSSTAAIPPPARMTLPGKKFEALDENSLHPLVNEQTDKDVWLMLLIFRFANALLVWTFFQPDEYFQSLEPAWQIVFGSQSGAWITWEWEHQLRSSLHPALFAMIYYLVDKPMELMGFFPQFRAYVLSCLPNVAQGIFAAFSDYYTWKLSQKIYGLGSGPTWAALLMTMFSPWQWFCSTRTFSNSLEMTMTIAAMYLWPWEVTVDSVRVDSKLKAAPAKTGTSPSIFATAQSIKSLRISLLLALTACILRPTNLLIWFCILMPTLTRFVSSNSPSARVQFSDYLILIREFALCSIVVLSVSAISDHLYFGTWTFPPYQWLSYNISRDLAVFYGRNDWHYFLTQGLPLLLTTYLPFALVALYQSTSKSDIRFLFTTTILTTIGSLSLVSHKEVRFIYPLLPLLHILTAPTINSFFTTTTTKTTHPPPFPSTPKTETITTTHRRPLLALLLLLNLSIGAYTTLFHQAGVISVLKFLRYEYEDLALDIRGNTPDSPDFNKYGRPEDLGVVYEKQTDYDENETFAGFLMPCHSTPWRSQLFYPGLKAWALTCEPPLDIPAGTPERATYRDEADRFYDDPAKFLREEVNTRERPWPRYIVGFESIAPALTEYYEGEAGMPGFRVMERWRAQNSHWHDDERRRGDVVVWEFMDGTKIKAREERKRLEKEMEEESKKNTYWLRDWNVPTLGDLGLEGVFGRAEGDADVQV